MLISLNSLKKYVKIPAKMTTTELVQRIGARLVEVESVENLGEKYRNIFIVKVEECEKIPDTHLSLCKINRGEKELTQVVCGAPNVREGLWTVWLAPGAIVPATFAGEKIEIAKRKLRGYESEGMLAGADELDFGDDHTGIVELDPEKWSVGENFAEAFDLNDIILDIENKSLTHRPDTFGIIGFAREVAGILGIKFEQPELFARREACFEGLEIKTEEKITITCEDETICAGYYGAVVKPPKGYNKRKQYLTLQDVFLYKLGMRPITPLVDLTNLIMLETGQPLHAFDFDKFLKLGKSNTAKIGVRTAKKGERLELLDGETLELAEKDIVITSNGQPAALAGAMGGKATEIDDETEQILLESASFSLYNLRKTQMHHGIFSEAITRFTKGQPAAIAAPVLGMALKHLGGEVKGLGKWQGKNEKETKIMIPIAKVNAVLGSNYSAKMIQETLENVNLTVDIKNDIITIDKPFWRTDLAIEEDIIEEIGRLNGYDKLPTLAPVRALRYSGKNEQFERKKQIRDCLSWTLGAHEVLTYSFINRRLEEKAGLDAADSYEISNSISPDLQVFRQAIIPSLVEKTYENLKAGYGDFALYEINQVTKKKWGQNAEKVPIIQEQLALVGVSNYYTAKAYIERLLAFLGVSAVLEPVKGENVLPAYFEPSRSMTVKIDEEIAGYVGEISRIFRKKMKIKPVLAGLELDCEKLKRERKQAIGVTVSRFPGVYRDLTVKTNGINPNFAALEAEIWRAVPKSLILELTPGTVYQASGSETINYTFHLKWTNPEKTLLTEEISAIMKEIIENLARIGAQVE